MKIIFLGLMYDRLQEKKYLELSKIGLPGAINSFQWSLIDGIINNNEEIEIINTLPFGIFPIQYSCLFLPSRRWKYKENICHEIGYINLPWLKMKIREILYYRKIKKIIKQTDDKIVILGYSLYLPYLKVIKKLKKRHNNIHMSIIIPDLPCEYGILPKGKLKRYISMYYGKKTMSFNQYIDSFVLLTEEMKKPLGLKEKPFVVVEGILNSSSILEHTNNAKKKVIFYSGTLDVKFGIELLLDAFCQISNCDIELWICGAGNAEEQVKQAAIKDDRIKFLGYCSYDDVKKLREQATILVNPRNSNDEFTRYSFPSKTIEYLASGIPVVMYKLKGIPKEYDKHIYYVQENTSTSLCNKLIEVLKLSDDVRRKRAEEAKKFVISKKNDKYQAKKILDMLRKDNN